MFEILQYDFIRNALMAAILIGIPCGVVGSFIVIKKIVFISGGIAHAVFGGLGLGYLLGFDPILTALPFSVLSALGIGTISKKVKISEDSAIGIIWVFGMALGVLFIQLSPGYAPDLFSFLFGSILTVPITDIYLMLILDAIIISLVFLFYKELLAISFDEEYAAISGVPTRALYLLLLSLVAVSVVMLIRVVGVILVIALLTIPAISAGKFTNRLVPMIILSVFIAIIMSVVGLLFSYLFDLPSGATIVLVLTVFFGLIALTSKAFNIKSSRRFFSP